MTITDETAPYIAATISNQSADKDLASEQGVRDALTYETVIGQGDIARTWGEYLAGAIERVKALEGQLKGKVVFLFYSESGLGKKAAGLLREAGILVIDPKKLTRFEAF